MCTSDWTDKERVIAERAVLAYREVCKATEDAPWGQGLAFTERIALNEGRKLTVQLLEEALLRSARGEKGGPTLSGVPADECPTSSDAQSTKSSPRRVG